jgi:hypothetical protein
MFALDGPLLKMSPRQCERILQASRGCTFLRDWVFVGRTPLFEDHKFNDIKRFCRTVKDALRGDDEVHELFLSRTQNSLQACQYTMTALESLLEKTRLRLTRIRYECDIKELDMMFGMGGCIYTLLYDCYTYVF